MQYRSRSGFLQAAGSLAYKGTVEYFWYSVQKIRASKENSLNRLLSGLESVSGGGAGGASRVEARKQLGELGLSSSDNSPSGQRTLAVSPWSMSP